MARWQLCPPAAISHPRASLAQADPLLYSLLYRLLYCLLYCRYTKEPEAQLNPKKKQFEKIAPDLRVDASEAGGGSRRRCCAVRCGAAWQAWQGQLWLAHLSASRGLGSAAAAGPCCHLRRHLALCRADGVCVYRGVPMLTSAGPVTASIPNAWIK